MGHATTEEATSTATSVEPPPTDSNDEEEFWPAPSLLAAHKIHTIRFGGSNGRNNEPKVLRYKSMSSDELTPLDMIYGSNNNINNDHNNTANENADDPFQDEFYDGTGNLMWMAAVCFGHLVAQEVEPLWSYLFAGSPNQTPSVSPEAGRKMPNTRRFCELGCGTGGAGISLLVCSSKTNQNNNNCHVVFTDNDAQSLDLCESNCELNHLPPETYSQALLGWGSEHLETDQSSREGLQQKPHSFDVVLATDVVYDLKMIAPLFQTVDFLLKKKSTQPPAEGDDDDGSNGGHLVLSHVPRFCIPKDETEDDEDDLGRSREGIDQHRDDDDRPSNAFWELEKFIHTEARKVGLVLAETIRPHQVLSEEGLSVKGNDNGGDSGNDDEIDNDSMQQLTLENMKEAHAVVFVFRRF